MISYFLVAQLDHNFLYLSCCLFSLIITNYVVVLQAERVIFYILEVPNGNEAAILTELQNAKSLDANRLQYLNEYIKRVFPKMPKTLSDSEDES